MNEVVEMCPHCETENVYPGYEVEKNGYKVICKNCGREIMLCDECLHDNILKGPCDWRSEKYFNGSRITEIGICRRGITHNKFSIGVGR